MADTIRTKTEALAFIVLGVAKCVGGQDFRDIVYSLYEKAYFSTAITLPALADVAVATPAAGTIQLYYSSTKAGVAFKDSAGVVHELAEVP